MELAIVTAGAVGAFFGAKFIEAGAKVRFVARGSHLNALKESGLRITTKQGDFEIAPDRYLATEDAAEAVRGVDMVLFAVKSFDTEGVARSLLPGLGQATPVLSLQNGVDNEATLAEVLGASRTAGGVAYVFANLSGPGVVNVPAGTGRFVVAEHTLAGQPLTSLADFRSLCEAAGLKCETTPDIARAKWTKLVFNSALNGWTTLRRTTLDQILVDPDRRTDFVATMRETEAVARAAGVDLDPQVIENTLKLADGLGSVGSSMLSDLESGKRLELDALNGSVVRQGEALGVPTPFNKMLYDELSLPGQLE